MILDKERAIDSISFKKLQKNNIDSALFLQEKAYEKLLDKETYVPEKRQELLLGIEKGFLLGAFFEERLCGFWNLIPYGDDLESYFYDCPDFVFTKKENGKSLINFESAVVDQSFRGLGIDKKAVAICVDSLKNRFDYFACTVSPKNTPSLKAMIKNQFYPCRLKKKYGGKERLILIKRKAQWETEKTAEKLSYNEKEKMNELFKNKYIITSIDKENRFVFKKLK